jgi:hypothetical protein
VKLTPFGYIKGPYYTYQITYWSGLDRTVLTPIYVGRGRGMRARSYFRMFGRRRADRWHYPTTHNKDLNSFMGALRRRYGFGVGIIAHDHGWDLAACKQHEKDLVRQFGRVGVHPNGTLLNRNSGG